MSLLCMLNTNTVGYLIKGSSPAIKKKLQQVSMNSIMDMQDVVEAG